MMAKIYLDHFLVIPKILKIKIKNNSISSNKTVKSSSKIGIMIKRGCFILLSFKLSSKTINKLESWSNIIFIICNTINMKYPKTLK